MIRSNLTSQLGRKALYRIIRGSGKQYIWNAYLKSLCFKYILMERKARYCKEEQTAAETTTMLLRFIGQARVDKDTARIGIGSGIKLKYVDIRHVMNAPCS
jgi:hypothetical protein